MIFDDISDMLRRYPMGELTRKTGLRKGRLASLRGGCTFNLDYDLVAALDRLGYRITLEKKDENSYHG